MKHWQKQQSRVVDCPTVDCRVLSVWNLDPLLSKCLLYHTLVFGAFESTIGVWCRDTVVCLVCSRNQIMGRTQTKSQLTMSKSAVCVFQTNFRQIADIICQWWLAKRWWWWPSKRSRGFTAPIKGDLLGCSGNRRKETQTIDFDVYDDDDDEYRYSRI